MSKKTPKTTDAVEILHQRYVKDDPETLAELEKIRADNDVARKIYDLRTKEGLSQRALAKLVGTTASVICRLEDADYDGHSLAMLTRIATALDKRVEIRFLPIKSNHHPKHVSDSGKTGTEPKKPVSRSRVKTSQVRRPVFAMAKKRSKKTEN